MAFLLCPEHMRQTKAYLDDNKWPLPDSPDEFAYLAVGQLSAHYVCDVCQAPLPPGEVAAFLANLPAPQFDEDVFTEIESVHYYGPVPASCTEALERRMARDKRRGPLSDR
jgi:hypothetical protein